MKAELAAGDTYLRVTCEFDADGGRWLAELPSVNDNITEMVQEVLSVDHVVRIARIMANAIAEQFPAMMREDAAEDA